MSDVRNVYDWYDCPEHGRDDGYAVENASSGLDCNECLIRRDFAVDRLVKAVQDVKEGLLYAYGLKEPRLIEFLEALKAFED